MSDRYDLELACYSAKFDLRLPGEAERAEILRRVIAEHDAAEGRKARVDAKAFDLLVRNLSGLTYADTERLARRAVLSDAAITAEHLPGVMQAKYRLLNRDGALSYEHDTTNFAAVAGFRSLKQWLIQRRAAFAPDRPPHLDPPKGILLLGVQGCGKSLAAKAAAGALGLPLLRLDAGALYNKFHGESERNVREALRNADTMSPCVLWIDEIEKGRQLPPELLRKGRFDEIFFVDLPNAAERSEVLRIHLGQRGVTLPSDALPALVNATAGYSGAEIEQGVVGALYAAHAVNETLDANHLLAEYRRTKPLSVLMAEQVSALREWAKERTVPSS